MQSKCRNRLSKKMKFNTRNHVEEVYMMEIVDYAHKMWAENKDKNKKLKNVISDYFYLISKPF